MKRSFGKKIILDKDRAYSAQAGGSTIEILVAFVVITLALTAVMMVIFGNQSFAIDTKVTQRALYHAERGVEIAFASSTNDFSNLATTFFSLPLAGAEDDIYETEGNQAEGKVKVTPISECVKKVESYVDWEYENSGRTRQASFSSIFVSTTTSAALGKNCDTVAPKSDWDNPHTLGEYKPSGADIAPTAVDVIRQDGKRLAFLTSLDTPENKPDLWVVDVSDSTIENPAEVHKIQAGGCRDIGGGQKPCGLTDIVVANDYAYVTSASSTVATSSHEFQIINIEDIQSKAPVLINSLTLGIKPDCSNPKSSTCPGGGRTLDYYNNRVYLGTHRIGGPELFIIDPDSSNPQIKSSLNINHNVNDIIATDGIIYVATSDNSGELHIYETANDNLSLIGQYDAEGTADGTALAISGNKILLGRDRDKNKDDFFVIDVTDKTKPKLLGSRDLDEKLCQDESNNLPKSCLASNSSITGVQVRGSLVFIIASQPTTNFQVWEFDGQNIDPVSKCNAYNYAEKATGIDFYENYGFVSSESNSPLRILEDKDSACSNGEWEE